MSTPRQGGALGDELANLGIIALIAAAVLAVILRVAGTVTAWVTGDSAADRWHRSRPRCAPAPRQPGHCARCRRPEPRRVLDRRGAADPRWRRGGVVGVARVPRAQPERRRPTRTGSSASPPAPTSRPQPQRKHCYVAPGNSAPPSSSLLSPMSATSSAHRGT